MQDDFRQVRIKTNIVIEKNSTYKAESCYLYFVFDTNREPDIYFDSYLDSDFYNDLDTDLVSELNSDLDTDLVSELNIDLDNDLDCDPDSDLDSDLDSETNIYLDI